MKLLARRRAAAPDVYADRVLDVLVEVFGDLAAEPTRGVVHQAVVRQLERPSAAFEVIVDHPIAANWRLKSVPDRAGAFRVGDCRLLGTAPRPDVDAANVALLDLAVEMGR